MGFPTSAEWDYTKGLGALILVKAFDGEEFALHVGQGQEASSKALTCLEQAGLASFEPQ